MVGLWKLEGINQVMNGVRAQIIDSVQYCHENFTGFDNPEQLFNHLKACTTFVHDEAKIEQIQSAETLFENNIHGFPGAGDCDCFTVLSIACFIANGWYPFAIVLAGRKTSYPAHIYCQVKHNGKWHIFDLTNTFIDEERIYRYKQVLPLKTQRK